MSGISISMFDPAPESDRIRREFLLSFNNLVRNDASIKSIKNENKYSHENLGKLSKIVDDTNNIIALFNQNIDSIAKGIHSSKALLLLPSESFETFCSNYPGESAKGLKDLYERQLGVKHANCMEKAKETAQLSELAYVADSLLMQINRTFKKITKICAIIEGNGLTPRQTPIKKLEINTSPLQEFQRFIPQLRIANPPPTPPLSTPPKPEQTTQTQAPASTPSTEATLSVKVTANYDVGFGKTLGICYEPHWEKAPIVLSNVGNDWSGEVPTDKAWKFVMIKNGQVIKWETAKDRNCDGKTDPSALNYTGQVKFA